MKKSGSSRADLEGRWFRTKKDAKKAAEFLRKKGHSVYMRRYRWGKGRRSDPITGRQGKGELGWIVMFDGSPGKATVYRGMPKGDYEEERGYVQDTI